MTSHLIIYFLLILTCLLSFISLFLFQDKTAKILSLAFIYANFLILVIIISLKLGKQSEVLKVMSGIFVLFAINLMVGFAISKNTKSEI